MAGVQLYMIEKWAKDVDPQKEWLCFETSEKDKTVVKQVYCRLCRKFSSKLRAIRNFNDKFVNGISGNSLKKDNVVKHSKSDMHGHAVNFEKNPGPLSLDAIYKSTPLGRAFASASATEMETVGRLMEIAYMVAIEELPFSKFQAIANLEIRHGVKLGTAYLNDKGCKTFTNCISETILEDLVGELNECPYLTILVDGSTDVSVQEKELIYVFYVYSGQVRFSFLRLKNVKHVTAEGIMAVSKRQPRLQERGFNSPQAGLSMAGSNSLSKSSA